MRAERLIGCATLEVIPRSVLRLAESDSPEKLGAYVQMTVKLQRENLLSTRNIMAKRKRKLLKIGFSLSTLIVIDVKP